MKLFKKNIILRFLIYINDNEGAKDYIDVKEFLFKEYPSEKEGEDVGKMHRFLKFAENSGYIKINEKSIVRNTFQGISTRRDFFAKVILLPKGHDVIQNYNRRWIDVAMTTAIIILTTFSVCLSFLTFNQNKKINTLEKSFKDFQTERVNKLRILNLSQQEKFRKLEKINKNRNQEETNTNDSLKTLKK